MGRSKSTYTYREAGLHTEELNTRGVSKGRRYFHVDDTVKEHKKAHGCNRLAHAVSPGDLGSESLSPCKDLARDSSQRMGSDDPRGLSSAELAQVYDHHHRRAKRHTIQISTALDHENSVASEPFSEESAQYHLGHRCHVADARIQAMLQAEQDRNGPQEHTAGQSSHTLNSKHTLGKGKKMFGKECNWAMFRDHSGRVDAFGSDEITRLQKGRNCNRTDQLDHIFTDQLKPEEDHHHKKIFASHIEEAAHATEEVPLGVSHQLDLDTCGFLGKSKGRDVDWQHMSHDPISHKPDPRSPDQQLSPNCYGMNTSGKRKFLVQTNLDSGCRHRAKSQMAPCPTIVCSPSPPLLQRDLPPNQTPFYQDNLPESERAVKNEAAPGLRGARECERHGPPRKYAPMNDHTWSVFPSGRSLDKMDDMTAEMFIEGQDIQSPNNRTDRNHTDQELKNRQFREALGGSPKRNFGNAHNKSEFRFDYADDPSYKAEFVCKDAKIKWGAGHGRRKFVVEDHCAADYKGGSGNQTYTSNTGDKLMARNKPKGAPHEHVDSRHGLLPVANEDHTAGHSERIMSPDGSILLRRSRSVNARFGLKDELNEILECNSDNASSAAGRRKTNELIRPQSARRFPQKDFEKVTPRSVTPRPPKDHMPLEQRPLWKK